MQNALSVCSVPCRASGLIMLSIVYSYEIGFFFFFLLGLLAVIQRSMLKYPIRIKDFSIFLFISFSHYFKYLKFMSLVAWEVRNFIFSCFIDILLLFVLYF